MYEGKAYEEANVFPGEYYRNEENRVCYITLTVSRTVTLPDSAVTAREWVIADETGNTTSGLEIILSPESGTINGDATLAINSPFGSFVVYRNGTNWIAR